MATYNALPYLTNYYTNREAEIYPSELTLPHDHMLEVYSDDMQPDVFEQGVNINFFTNLAAICENEPVLYRNNTLEMSRCSLQGSFSIYNTGAVSTQLPVSTQIALLPPLTNINMFRCKDDSKHPLVTVDANETTRDMNIFLHTLYKLQRMRAVNERNDAFWERFANHPSIQDVYKTKMWTDIERAFSNNGVTNTRPAMCEALCNFNNDYWTGTWSNVDYNMDPDILANLADVNLNMGEIDTSLANINEANDVADNTNRYINGLSQMYNKAYKLASAMHTYKIHPVAVITHTQSASALAGELMSICFFPSYLSACSFF